MKDSAFRFYIECLPFRLAFLHFPFIAIFLVAAPILNAQEKRPNIVLIVSDDHGREAVGCYGNPVVKTANIDQLAKEGTRFSNAFATVASCSPSRAVILTGIQSHANGMYGLEHQQHHFSSFSGVQSLPVLLQRAGYRTARIGKFHVAPEQVYHFHTVLEDAGVNNPVSIGRSPVEMANACKAFINGTSSQPFFLYFATDDPHRSNTLTADGSPFFDGSKPNNFGNRSHGYPHITKNLFNPATVVVPRYLSDSRATREELAEYFQAINRMDQGIGRLLEHLKTSGKYDNTLIIYLSDNGAPFPGSKTTLYEPGIRLPLIVKPPKPTQKNFVQHAMVSWVDITPTILDFADASMETSRLHGRSFKKILEEEKVSGWDEVYGSHSLHEITMYYPMRMVRERKFKLIYNIASELRFPQALDLFQSYAWQDILSRNEKKLGQRDLHAYLHRPKFELYDLENDPDELNNLATNPKYEKELIRLQEKLKRWQKLTNDQWVSKWEFE